MGKKTRKSWGRKLTMLFVGVVLTSCSTSKEAYEVRYERAWKEVLKSQAWKDALKKDSNEHYVESNDFYASADETELAAGPAADHKVFARTFDDKYDFLVHRAYAKIIAEAEAADRRLEREFLDWNVKSKDENAQKDKAFRQEHEAVIERYKAHRKMLEGLKSWNVFSEYGTDDLDFFKDEYRENVRKMLQNGHGEGNITGFLVYKLADLYHFEE